MKPGPKPTTRLDILEQIREQPRTPTEIAILMGRSRVFISNMLRRLRLDGLAKNLGSGLWLAIDKPELYIEEVEPPPIERPYTPSVLQRRPLTYQELGQILSLSEREVRSMVARGLFQGTNQYVDVASFNRFVNQRLLCSPPSNKNR